MPLSNELGNAIDAVVDGERDALAKLSRDIHSNPELRFEERHVPLDENAYPLLLEAVSAFVAAGVGPVR